MRINHSKFPIEFIKIIAIAAVILAVGGVLLPSLQPRDVFAQTVHTCLNRMNVAPEDLHWVYVPESADELYTEEPYAFLAGRLIASGVVDASACPAAGLLSNGYANACGMAEALSTLIIVQNLMNQPILDAFYDVGVPPVLLKQVIATESQYWPARDGLWHHGYGHLTNIGIRNAMQWNPSLYSKVCPSSAIDCVTDVATAEVILASLIATCPTCEYGIDIADAERSVDILAEALLGYCFQTARLVFNATAWHSSLVVDYGSIWKLTLMNYNAGPQCAYDAVEGAFSAAQGPLRWSDLSANVSGDLRQPDHGQGVRLPARRGVAPVPSHPFDAHHSKDTGMGFGIARGCRSSFSASLVKTFAGAVTGLRMAR